ncbi:MAG: DUF4851 domain-containing protein [Desulfovibrio sp.]|uniref:DUF4851 domain-containing protein n=1 Tax=Desulfovibrio sp. TaxID=885 RepID=UPI002A3637AD|nr:DUF4851 domain-containing protein [Desulfovibrio sp.]MDY0258356.1 DUF4851 domain-containing protein [Desulfovibrio sp.]
MKVLRHVCMLALLAMLLAGCNAALQRGMVGPVYVSTARPAISLTVKDMPLIAGGQGQCSLTWTSAMGGLPVSVWLAAYGQGTPQSPLAIVAQAELPQRWYWDSDSTPPFSVDHATEVIGDTEFSASTFIVDSSRDPFPLLAGIKPGMPPVRWLVRSFTSRFNFNLGKVVLEYREPLPEQMAFLDVLTIAQTDQLKAFEQRARNTFAVGRIPENLNGLADPYLKNILWQFMDQRFLGTVSQNDTFKVN